MRWVQLCGSLNTLWHCLSLGLEWQLTFSSPVATAVFQICRHIECSTFTASSFRIWNSSAGIPSPLLALFIVMLPKAYFVFQDVWLYVSDHTIVIIWVMKIFLYSSSVDCHLFLISCASVKSMPFLYFIVPIFASNIPLVSLIFLMRSQSFPFYCFPLFLCTDHWGRLSYLSLLFFGTLHSNGYIWVYLQKTIWTWPLYHHSHSIDSPPKPKLLLSLLV